MVSTRYFTEDPYWSTWGEWSSFETDCGCGEGTKTRNRTCIMPPCPRYPYCDGECKDTMDCEIAQSKF